MNYYLGYISHLLVGQGSAKDSFLNKKIWACQFRSKVECIAKEIHLEGVDYLLTAQVTISL
jgi:hypothetical protein